MNRELSYQLELKWTGNTGIGNKTYTSYERSHEINFKNKPLLKCSSDPHFRGNPNLHNPEDLLKALHQKANEMCFIANSCNFPVYHNPTFIEPRQQVITDHG